jgi:shikimate kinase
VKLSMSGTNADGTAQGFVGGKEGAVYDLSARPIGGFDAATVGLTLFAAHATRLLNIELSALEAEGRGQIVSSPRVVTADRMKAVVEQGTELPYQAKVGQGVSGVQFRRATLKLEVEPQITPDGRVILDLGSERQRRRADRRRAGDQHQTRADARRGGGRRDGVDRWNLLVRRPQRCDAGPAPGQNTAFGPTFSPYRTSRSAQRTGRFHYAAGCADELTVCRSGRPQARQGSRFAFKLRHEPYRISRRTPLQPRDANANVFFVGLMGAGKTTVGRAVARRLDRPFFDSDHEIEARTGARIATIFELEGEAGFRDREAQTIADLTGRDNIVLATGGGAVLRVENREALSNRGLVVYLRANPHDLWLRTRRDKNRPLLQTDDPKGRLEALYEVRDPLYRECADFVIETGRPSVNGLVNMVLMQLEMAGVARHPAS